ncbi:MAG: hypothetical protein ACYCO4_03745 [Sulfobacillus sp.]
MRRRVVFFVTLLAAMAVPSAAFAAAPAATGGPSLVDVALLFVATFAAFLWLLSVFI